MGNYIITQSQDDKQYNDIYEFYYKESIRNDYDIMEIIKKFPFNNSNENEYYAGIIKLYKISCDNTNNIRDLIDNSDKFDYDTILNHISAYRTKSQIYLEYANKFYNKYLLKN